MNWVLLTIAGLFEVGWAIGLKYTQGFTRLWPSVWTTCPASGRRSSGLKASAICVRALRFRRQLTPNPLVMVRWTSPTTLKP
jgi:hypothetical protein